MLVLKIFGSNLSGRWSEASSLRYFQRNPYLPVPRFAPLEESLGARTAIRRRDAQALDSYLPFG